MPNDNAIPLDTVLWLLGGLSTVITAVFSFLIKLLLKTHKEKVSGEMKGIWKRIDALNQDILDSVAERKECEVRELRAAEKQEQLLEKLRDQWLEFQKNATTMEADRGRRLDALFQAVDHMKDKIQNLNSIILGNVEKIVKREIRAQSRED